jgi:hypothetical protein
MKFSKEEKTMRLEDWQKRGMGLREGERNNPLNILRMGKTVSKEYDRLCGNTQTEKPETRTT